MTRVTPAANADIDPVRHALEMHGGDDRATIAALLKAYFEAADEVDRLRRALHLANQSVSHGYDRGHFGALAP